MFPKSLRYAVSIRKVRLKHLCVVSIMLPLTHYGLLSIIKLGPMCSLETSMPDYEPLNHSTLAQEVYKAYAGYFRAMSGQVYVEAWDDLDLDEQAAWHCAV